MRRPQSFSAFVLLLAGCSFFVPDARTPGGSCTRGRAALPGVYRRVGGDAAVTGGHRLGGACVLVLAVRTGRPRGPPPWRAHPPATDRRPLARVHRPQPGVPRVTLPLRRYGAPGGRPLHAGRPVAGHRRRFGKGRFRRPGAGGRSFHRQGRSGTGKAFCRHPLAQLEGSGGRLAAVLCELPRADRGMFATATSMSPTPKATRRFVRRRVLS